MKLCVLSRTDQFHPYLTTSTNDVLWEEKRKRLQSDEELLMSYKNPTQPGFTDGRNNRHNEECILILSKFYLFTNWCTSELS